MAAGWDLTEVNGREYVARSGGHSLLNHHRVYRVAFFSQKPTAKNNSAKSR